MEALEIGVTSEKFARTLVNAIKRQISHLKITKRYYFVTVDFELAGWKSGLVDIKFFMYWFSTRFSDLSFVHSSFTLSKRWLRSKSRNQIEYSTYSLSILPSSVFCNSSICAINRAFSSKSSSSSLGRGCAGSACLVLLSSSFGMVSQKRWFSV